MSELRLEGGEEPEEEGAGRKPRGESERSNRRHRASIRERLFAIFDTLADSLEGRGDLELAGIIREDSRAMVGGLESLIKRVPKLAGVVLGGLSVVEPLIAFGRIFRVLARRMRERREEALEQANWEAGQAEEPEAELEPEEPPAPQVEVAGDHIARPWLLEN